MPKDRSVGAALVLTFLFGPLGLFYTAPIAALFLCLLGVLTALATFGLALAIVWPVSMLWAAVSASGRHGRYQAWLAEQSRQPVYPAAPPAPLVPAQVEPPAASSSPTWASSIGLDRRSLFTVGGVLSAAALAVVLFALLLQAGSGEKDEAVTIAAASPAVAPPAEVEPESGVLAREPWTYFAGEARVQVSGDIEQRLRLPVLIQGRMGDRLVLNFGSADESSNLSIRVWATAAEQGTSQGQFQMGILTRDGHANFVGGPGQCTVGLDQASAFSLSGEIECAHVSLLEMPSDLLIRGKFWANCVCD